MNWIWNWYKDAWLTRRKVVVLFLLSSFLVLAMTPVFLGKVDIDTALRTLAQNTRGTPIDLQEEKAPNLFFRGSDAAPGGSG